MKKRKRMTLQDKAEAALKEAVRQVVERHKKTGRPLAVWQNGNEIGGVEIGGVTVKSV